MTLDVSAQDLIRDWPDQSREATQIVIDQRGEPDEATESMLIWREAAPWKRVIATRQFHEHDFPAPHIDCLESVIDYRVPVDTVSALAEFDGSVVVERTAGEISARCHDEQANFLALNLANDIVTGGRSVEDARRYYAKEFLDFRKGEPTPYMEGLHFDPTPGADPDVRILSDEQLQQAVEAGEKGEGR